MNNNNTNVWGALMAPIIDRPGTPVGTTSTVHSTKGTPGRAPGCGKHTRKAKEHGAVHMPSELVAQRDNGNPWKLSPRQHQVLDMLVQGMSPTQIAASLGLSKSAVSKYTTEIKDRMEVETLPQAVVAWHRHYRVLQPAAALGDKDNTLIANLARWHEQNPRKEAA